MIENLEYFSIFLVFSLLAIAVFFLISQQKALQLIEPRFRYLKPGLVWLQLIPVFGWVWMFVVVKKNLAIGSTPAELRKRKLYRAAIGSFVTSLALPHGHNLLHVDGCQHVARSFIFRGYISGNHPFHTSHP